MKILIVDDSPDLLVLHKKFLEPEYACHTASSGDDVLEVLAATPVDLALIDIMMPRMTGLTLSQNVKDRYPDIAVIFLTSVDDLDLAVDQLKNGASDYVVEPVTRDRLRQSVNAALAKCQANVQETQGRQVLEAQIACQATALESRVRELALLN